MWQKNENERVRHQYTHIQTHARTSYRWKKKCNYEVLRALEALAIEKRCIKALTLGLSQILMQTAVIVLN